MYSNADEILEHALHAKEHMDQSILEDAEAHEITIPDDAIWIIDRKSGCHFLGRALVHTEQCMCGDYEN